MWGKKDNDDYMGGSYFDDGNGNRTSIKERLNKNNKPTRGIISAIAIIIVASIAYNFLQDFRDKDVTTTSNSNISKSHQEVDDYLVKFDEFSEEGFKFIDEVIAIYTDEGYSEERLKKLDEWSAKMEAYDFSSYTNSKYSKGNENIVKLKGYLKESALLLKTSGAQGLDIYEELDNIVSSYDAVDGEYMDIIIKILEDSNIKYVKTSDGGVDYWLK